VLNTRDHIASELKKCAKSFHYFAENYVKIVGMDSAVLPLKLNEAQRLIISRTMRNNHTMVLKARKLGSSTVIAAYYLWKALFNKNTRVAVVAHTDPAAKELFTMYQFMYSNLPAEMKVSAVRNRDNRLEFKTGSKIVVGSAGSESFRGQTYQYIHASEYAFWSNIDTAIAALFQTGGANATIIFESTANGLNKAHELWGEDNGFDKIFLGWKIDERYNLPHCRFKDLTEKEREYTRKHKLTSTQSNWFVNQLRTKCANNWLIFNQEFPATAELAFVTSGQRFFPDPWPVTGYSRGIKIYKEPQPYRIYTIGVDTASGSPGGDYSAFMVLDVTNDNKIEMVASYYDKDPPSDYKEEVYDMAMKYEALAVIESNSYGLSIIEYMMSKAYPHMFRDQHWDKAKNQWTPRYGFNTNSKSRNLMMSRLYQFITSNRVEVIDGAFISEANSLAFNARGKVEAPSGKHDDMVMAVALALMGLDQVHDLVEEVAAKVRPTGVKEMLKWEQATGRLFSEATSEDFSPDPVHEVLNDIGVW